MNAPVAIPLPPPPKTSLGHAPPRRAGSVRRTCSIDVEWPEGYGGPYRLIGRARDLATAVDGAVATVNEGAFEARLDDQRRIVELGPDPRLEVLLGERASGRLRVAIAEKLPEEFAGGTPLYLALDDISGASLVSAWAWACWQPDWQARIAEMKAQMPSDQRALRENVCVGLATGSSGLSLSTAGAVAVSLRNPADPDGWHDFPELTGCSFRRARRIDVWHDGAIRIEAHFQDTATTPDGGRAAIHEYSLSASADPETLELLSLEPVPHVLPFPECPAAVHNARALVGTRLPAMRERVLAELRGTAGCTHLNDVLRALTDVPVLVRGLEGSR